MKASPYGVIGTMRSWCVKRCKVASTLGIIGASAVLPLRLANAQPAELPDGPGKALLLENCTACHGAEMITMQRRSPDEWAQVVNRMIGNGASLTDDQYKEAVAYLGAYLGKDPAPPPAPDAKAKSK